MMKVTICVVDYVVQDGICCVCFVSYENWFDEFHFKELVQLDLAGDHYSRCLGVQSPDADKTFCFN